MCELMGMCFARPISADFTIREFAAHGKENADGWGLAWYPDRSVALIKEPVKWRASRYTGFLETYPDLQARSFTWPTCGTKRPAAYPRTPTRIPSCASGRDGSIASRTTVRSRGPFWELPLGRFRPVGGTDSEYLLCYLEELASQNVALDTAAGCQHLHRTLAAVNPLESSTACWPTASACSPTMTRRAGRD